MVSRAVDAVMVNGAKRNLASADVVIEPDLEGLDSLDWNKVDEWRARGYKAAEAKAAELLTYSVSQDEYDAHEAARAARRRTGADRPLRHRRDRRRPGRRGEGRAAALGEAGTAARRQPAGKGSAPPERHRPLRTADVQPGRRRRRDPPRDHCPSEAERSGVSVARRRAEQRRFGRFRADGRGPHDDLRRRGRRVGSEGSTSRSAPACGGAASCTGRSACPGCSRRPGSSPAAASGTGSSATGSSGSTWRSQADAGFDLGVNFGRRAELRVGVDAARVEETLRVGDPSLPEAHGTQQFASARLVYDGQDSPVVPSQRGLRRRERPPLLLGTGHHRPVGGRRRHREPAGVLAG